jgi:hypothetical protein
MINKQLFLGGLITHGLRNANVSKSPLLPNSLSFTGCFEKNDVFTGHCPASPFVHRLLYILIPSLGIWP